MKEVFFNKSLLFTYTLSMSSSDLLAVGVFYLDSTIHCIIDSSVESTIVS